MKENIAVVVTSIAQSNPVLQSLARGCQEKEYQFIVIGDEASPPDFHLAGCRFYSLDEQRALGFRFAQLCPTRHYARKNIGYLIAMREGASIIIETDDDNIPDAAFWHQRSRTQSVRTLENSGWVNVYRYFSAAKMWPRGLPLEHINDPVPPFEDLAMRDADCPIQQGLVNHDPDVDAIYRLTLPLPQSFRRDRRVALTLGSWCPFNSQNTTWWADAFPLLYLPAFCSFRMTDIWRSFVAQRIAWTNNWSILFHEPTVWQERNEHNVMRDFADEVPGYLNNSAICEALSDLQLQPGSESMPDNLRACYEKFVGMGLLDQQELHLIKAWVEDLNQLIPKATPATAR